MRSDLQRHCRLEPGWLAPPGLVRVAASSKRERIWTLAAELRRAGITSVVLPSDRCIGVWDLEVPAEAAEAAEAILVGVAMG